MKILVTGGSGFIGRNVVEYLTKKYEVLSPTHRELELLDEDAVRLFLEKHTVDVVVHCAVKPGHRNAKDPTNQLYVDTRMFFNLARNTDLFQKLICISSGAVYDVRYNMIKISEEYFDTHMPVDEHGLFRYIAAKYIEKAERIIELRPFSVFGKYEDYAIRFISNAICKTLLDLPITIKQNRRFDFIYIDDLARVIDYFIGKEGKFKCYNVTPDEAMELRIIAEKVREISGKDLPILIAQDEIGLEYSGDNQRLRREIPGLSFTPIDQAIHQLHDWYASNRHLLNREFLLVDK